MICVVISCALFCFQTKGQKCVRSYCLSNALHSSIGQNVKLLACPVSDIQSPMSDI